MWKCGRECALSRPWSVVVAAVDSTQWPPTSGDPEEHIEYHDLQGSGARLLLGGMHARCTMGLAEHREGQRPVWHVTLRHLVEVSLHSECQSIVWSSSEATCACEHGILVNSLHQRHSPFAISFQLRLLAIHTKLEIINCVCKFDFDRRVCVMCDERNAPATCRNQRQYRLIDKLVQDRGENSIWARICSLRQISLVRSLFSEGRLTNSPNNWMWCAEVIADYGAMIPFGASWASSSAMRVRA